MLVSSGATLSVTEGRATPGPRVLALRSAPIVSGGASLRPKTP